MTSWVSSRTKPHYGPHPPASRDTYEKLDAWRRSAWAKLKDPTAAEPDHSLLFAGEPTQFHSMRLDTLAGETAVYYRVATRKHDFKERVLWPEAFAFVRGLTLFGGGVNVDDAGKGLSYPRVFGGHLNVQIARLLKAARPGEIARQLAESETGKDFRAVTPDAFVRSAEDTYQPAMSGGSRSPSRGRPHAVRTAVNSYHQPNHTRTEIGISADEYEALLWDLFALHDAIETKRSLVGASASPHQR